MVNTGHVDYKPSTWHPFRSITVGFKLWSLEFGSNAGWRLVECRLGKLGTLRMYSISTSEQVIRDKWLSARYFYLERSTLSIIVMKSYAALFDMRKEVGNSSTYLPWSA
jgi:hypothetical protein